LGSEGFSLTRSRAGGEASPKKFAGSNYAENNPKLLLGTRIRHPTNAAVGEGACFSVRVPRPPGPRD
jgi:hypothetical protein